MDVVPSRILHSDGLRQGSGLVKSSAAMFRWLANAGVVVGACVLEDTVVDDLSVRWRLRDSDALSVYFDTDITLKNTTARKSAIARAHVQHLIQIVTILRD
jgi:hypothetical protein